MANKIRGNKNVDREWWLEEHGGNIRLICSTDKITSRCYDVLEVQKDGSLFRFTGIRPDGLNPPLQLDSRGRIKMEGEE